MNSRGVVEGEMELSARLTAWAEGRATPRLITRSESGAIIQECPLQFIPLRAIRPLNNAMLRRAER